MNVTSVKESKWMKDGETVISYYVSFDNGQEIPCYDAQAKDLKSGEPLPQGWEIATGKSSGKNYLKVPKRGGGGFGGGGATAFRNTKEGSIAEQRSIHASVSLTQARELARDNGVHAPSNIIAHAEDFFSWLQSKTTGGGGDVPKTGPGGPDAFGTLPPPVQSSDVSIAGPTAPAEPVTAGSTSGTTSVPASADNREQGPEPDGEAGKGPCSHPPEALRAELPSGRPAPKNRIYCSACRTVL